MELSVQYKQSRPSHGLPIFILLQGMVESYATNNLEQNAIRIRYFFL